MGSVTTDGTNESTPESHGRIPAWCWIALAIVWVGIAATCVNLQLRVNDSERHIARLEQQREHAIERARNTSSRSLVDGGPETLGHRP